MAQVIMKSPVFNGFDPNCFIFVTKHILESYPAYIEYVSKIYDMYIRAKKIRKAQLLGESIDELSLRYTPNEK